MPEQRAEAARPKSAASQPGPLNVAPRFSPWVSPRWLPGGGANRAGSVAGSRPRGRTVARTHGGAAYGAAAITDRPRGIYGGGSSGQLAYACPGGRCLAWVVAGEHAGHAGRPSLTLQGGPVNRRSASP